MHKEKPGADDDECGESADQDLHDGHQSPEQEEGEDDGEQDTVVNTRESGKTADDAKAEGIGPGGGAGTVDAKRDAEGAGDEQHVDACLEAVVEETEEAEIEDDEVEGKDKDEVPTLGRGELAGYRSHLPGKEREEAGVEEDEDANQAPTIAVEGVHNPCNCGKHKGYQGLDAGGSSAVVVEQMMGCTEIVGYGEQIKAVFAKGLVGKPRPVLMGGLGSGEAGEGFPTEQARVQEDQE